MGDPWHHHDAWVNGASDPIAYGCLLEEARACCELSRQDGSQSVQSSTAAMGMAEEPQSLGLNRWVREDPLRDELQKKTVAYIKNSDGNGGDSTLRKFAHA